MSAQRSLLAALAVLAFFAAGCGRQAEPAPQPEPAVASPAAPAAPAAPEAMEKADGVVTVAFLGDSLTAGFGLDPEQAFPHLVQQALVAEGFAVQVVNAGISGDTTAGGLARTDWLLKRKPDVLVIGLGGNDGLRGMPLAGTEKNLRGILAKGRAAGARMLLVGMMIPPNYGPEYTAGFAGIYPKLAEEFGIPLLPFLLEGVAGKRELNQADGIHPTAAGHEILARTVLEALRPLVKEAAAEKNR
jgi:acyl-CoA thioesterase-1